MQLGTRAKSMLSSVPMFGLENTQSSKDATGGLSLRMGEPGRKALQAEMGSHCQLMKPGAKVGQMVPTGFVV